MKYELLNATSRGILIDRTPIILDIRDTFTVSFLLPADGMPYVAIFKGENDIEHKKVVINGTCNVPKELLTKEQYLQLLVCQLDNDTIAKTYYCEPIQVTALIYLRQNQWCLSGGMIDDDCYKRLNELEKQYSKALENIEKMQYEMKENNLKTEDVITQNITLVANFNNAITVVNDLSKRIKLLEKNYDPTIID